MGARKTRHRTGVARDLWEPTYKFITRLNEDMFAGTPYTHDALGTRESVEATTAENAEVLSGLVRAEQCHPRRRWRREPAGARGAIRDLYGKIGRRPLPPRPDISLNAVKPETFTLDSDRYALAFIAYRLPGTDSPDFAATRVMADVLSSQRGNLYALVPQGRALEAQFELAETYPKASVGFSVAALPVGSDAVLPSGEDSVARLSR